MNLKTIKVLNQKGETTTGDKWPVQFNQYGNDKSWSWLGSYREDVATFLDTLPTYFRGKLKGDLQLTKDGETLIISEEYYAKILANAGAALVRDSGKTFRQFHFPDMPAMYLYKLDDLPNIMGLYSMIEESYCNTRYACRSFSGLELIVEQYEKFKAFKESSSWKISCEPTGYVNECLSVNIWIGKEWHYLTRLQPHEQEYWAPLFTKKTKTITGTPIDKVIETNEKINKKFLVATAKMLKAGKPANV